MVEASAKDNKNVESVFSALIENVYSSVFKHKQSYKNDNTTLNTQTYSHSLDTPKRNKNNKCC